MEGRYATALFSAASKQNKLDQMEQELGKVFVSQKCKCIGQWMMKIVLSTKSYTNADILGNSLKPCHRIQNLKNVPISDE